MTEPEYYVKCNLCGHEVKGHDEAFEQGVMNHLRDAHKHNFYYLAENLDYYTWQQDRVLGGET